VKPLDASYDIKRICIRENPKVTISDFVPVISDGLNRHNIVSEFIASDLDKEKIRSEGKETDRYYMNITQAPNSCEYNLIYTARRSWDFGTYLSTADIEILKKGDVIATANYHLINKGGLSLFKWQGVETKIAPVMDELLHFYSKDMMGLNKKDL